MNRHLLLLALAASSLLPAGAIEPGKSQILTSPDQIPEGLSTADWSNIRSAYATSVTSQQAYVKASHTGEYDEFGFCVAVSGDTVVVGASGEDSSTTGVDSVPNEGTTNSGAAYVFTRSGGIWSQQAYLKASNPGGFDQFGYSVAISGDTIVVGAYAERSAGLGVNGSGQADNSAPTAGAAYVFTRSLSTWSQQAYLKASNTGAGDNFGQSVAISGDTIAVGAIGEDSSAVGVNGDEGNNSASFSGAAYVFARNGTTWSQQAYLKASNAETFDLFGFSVAVSGDTVVVGATHEASSAVGVNANATAQMDNSSTNAGAAYVFTRSVSTWSQQAYLKASNSQGFDEFGRSVAVAGDTVVVGASGESSNTKGVNGNEADNSATNSGAAYVFTRSSGTWSQQAYLKSSNSGANDYFGWSVAVSEDAVVIGALEEDSNAVGVDGNQTNNLTENSGAAYVFTRSSGIWGQQAYLKSSNTGETDTFGNSVSVSGGTIISGSHQEDSVTTGINSVPNDTGTADNSGAAYIFTLPVAEPPPIIPPAVVKYLVKVKVSNTKFGKITGSGSFATGSKVTLKAKAKKGHKFLGWYEKKKLITKKPVLVIKKLTKNRSLVAKFK